MMTKMTYLAIFHPEADGGYSVDFPDLPGCVTEGDTLSEARWPRKHWASISAP